jgi:hypothetical protein
MPKMVEIHETSFEALNEVKIAMDRIVNDALTDDLKDLEKRMVLVTEDCATFGAKVLEIVKEYMGDEW